MVYIYPKARLLAKRILGALQAPEIKSYISRGPLKKTVTLLNRVTLLAHDKRCTNLLIDNLKIYYLSNSWA